MLRLRYELFRMGISQRELSEMSGVSYTIISSIISGRYKPYPKWKNAIAEAIGWEGDPSKLFEEVEIVD